MYSKIKIRIRHVFHIMRVVWRRYPWFGVTIKFGLVYVLFYLNAVHKIDPDFGWHLQSGNYYRAHGIVSHDIFTYTAVGHSWYNHEWGSDVIVSLVFQLGGYTLLSLLYAGLWTSGLMLSGLRTRSFTLLAATIALLPFAGIRAIGWTIPLVVLTRLILRSKRRHISWVLPPLFILWANLHGGFTIGLGLVAYAVAYERRLRLLPVLAASLLATLLNPFGWKLYIEICETLFDRSLHSQVSEWASFTFALATIPYVLLWASSLFLATKHSLRSWLRPSVILFAAAVSAQRNIPVFVAGSLRETDRHISRLLAALPKDLDRTRRVIVNGTVIVAVGAVLVAGWTVVWPLNQDRFSAYPTAAVSYLKQHGCAGGHLFNDYNDGGFLIWQLPSQKVFIDGRIPSWRNSAGQKYMSEYYALLDHPQTYYATFARYDIRCSLLQRSSRNDGLIRQLRQDGWRTAVETANQVLQVAPRKP